MSPTSSTNLPTPLSHLISHFPPLPLSFSPSWQPFLSLYHPIFILFSLSLSPKSHPSHNSSTPTSLTPVLTFSTIFHLLYDSTSTTHYHHNPPSLSLVACHTIRSSTSTAIVSHAQPRPSSCTTTISWDFFIKVILKLSK